MFICVNLFTEGGFIMKNLKYFGCVALVVLSSFLYGEEVDYGNCDIETLKAAAEDGVAEAQNYLGMCYLHGDAVQQDYKEAVKWFRKSAEQDYASGQYNLGYCYYTGKGVLKDYSEAFRWCFKAAKQGNDAAQFVVGGLLYWGQGVPKDEEEGLKWIRKSAEQGNTAAQEVLDLIESKK